MFPTLYFTPIYFTPSYWQRTVVTPPTPSPLYPQAAYFGKLRSFSVIVRIGRKRM